MIDLNWTFWVQAVNFLLVLLILNRLIFKPILKGVALRLEREEEDIRARDESLKRIASLEADMKRRLDEAFARSRQGLALARARSLDESSELIAAARAEFDEKINQARARIKTDSQSALREIEKEAPKLADAIVDRVIGSRATGL